ncbi:hypothetical protein V8B55DRAFT_1589564 [Mucor lusitanicus]|uniref:F-box domain-containing protein n=2 Tax=Mucor circinelloides f. lusitanicus TaxID=29924 RepID=A0A168IQ57_MUCCL|nr:hypothetical protein FB192DRAFT_1383384 [Mucor lusitanicus]OAD00213.1 hypothetical protein MUCCIDRAFT_113675 [Mucor lusitanicus CBS 277.49]
MKTITDLPSELLPNIFRFLPIYSQRQCLAVSRCWNASVRPSIPTDADKMDLHGYGGIRNLFTRIQANPEYGRRIRRLNFIMQTGTGRPITRNELVATLEGCPNLAEIDFVDVNPFYYLMYMVDEEVQIPKLELVRVGESHHLASLGHRFVDFAFYYRRTINRLKVHIDSNDFSLAVGVDSLNAYFHRFTALKHLNLVTRCPIVLDELLDACPSLQKLTLDAPPNSFQAIDPHIGALAEPIIETIEVKQTLMTAELYVYLRDHCRHLTQVSVFGHASADDNTVMSTFRRFGRQEALPIVNISFKKDFPVSAAMLESIHVWFPNVCQIELKESNLFSVTGGSKNIALNFGNLHLQYLSLDLNPLIGRRRSVCNKVALEIISGNTTTWYQRDGKCRAQRVFNLKTRTSYIKAAAKQKRLESNTTSVITIQAAYVNNIRVHITNRHSSLNQLIHLEDDEQD